VFANVIGETVSSEITNALMHGLGPPKSVLSFLLIPWNFTFNFQYIAIGEWIGPIYFLSLPLAVYGIVKSQLGKLTGFFILFYLIGWFFMGPHERYLLPILPLCLIPPAIGLSELVSKRSRNKWVQTLPWLFVSPA